MPELLKGETFECTNTNIDAIIPNTSLITLEEQTFNPIEAFTFENDKIFEENDEKDEESIHFIEDFLEMIQRNSYGNVLKRMNRVELEQIPYKRYFYCFYHKYIQLL